MPYTEKFLEEFPKKLSELQKKSGVSIQKTADITEVSASTITRMLNGQSEPNIVNLARVVKAWGGSLDELTGIEPKTVTVTKTEVVYADERLINLYERAIASKNRWIRWLFVLTLVLVFFFIGVLIFDVITPDAGWYQ